MKRLIVVTAAVLIPLLAAGLDAAEGRLLTGSELESVLMGAKMYTVSMRSGRDVVVTYGDDGSYRVDVPSTGWIDRGKWWIEGNQYCYERTQASGCATLYHLEGDRYLFEDERGQGQKVTIRK